MLWGEAGWCLGEGKQWTHMLAVCPLQGCFFLVTSTMESKMSVVAGISFGIACFQVNLRCLAREQCRVRLACLQRHSISVQDMYVYKRHSLSQPERNSFSAAIQCLTSPPVQSPGFFKPKAEAPTLFP